MTGFKDAKDYLMRPENHVHWIRLLIALAGLVVVSFAFSALLQFLKSRLNLPIYEFESIAYITVFVASLLANSTIVAPVPFAIAIMVTAAHEFNPIIIAFLGAAGGTIGELSGYYAGRWGKKLAIPDTVVGYKRLEGWIHKYGLWAIILIAFQPIIPFDVGGLIAGAAKMPLIQFVPALFLGKFPKYLILTYAGIGIIGFLPPWLTGN